MVDFSGLFVALWILPIKSGFVSYFSALTGTVVFVEALFSQIMCILPPVDK